MAATIKGSYAEGYRNGHLDHYLGVKSILAWTSQNSPNPYMSVYSEGYQDGYLSLARRRERPE